MEGRSLPTVLVVVVGGTGCRGPASSLVQRQGSGVLGAHWPGHGAEVLSKEVCFETCVPVYTAHQRKRDKLPLLTASLAVDKKKQM